jgi:hypothetical protein
MTNSQAREVVTSHPELWPRVFTVKSFVRWAAGQQPPRAGLSRSWLDEAGAGRDLHELLGSAQGDEIEDPMGRSPRVWRRVAAEISAAVDRMVPLMPVQSRVPAS